jgi:hypothetical protein
MIDVKKLITGFLVLATAATCSGIIFSFVNFAPATTANATPQATIGGGTGSAVADENAFLPTEDQVQQAAADLEPELASSSMMVTSTDPSNLTEDLATGFVNGIVSANPTGPTGTDSDGNPTFTSPDMTAVGLNVAEEAQNISIPDWNVEAAAIPVATISTSSAAALTNYGNDVYNALNDHLANNDQVQSVVTEDPTSGVSAEELSYVQSQMQGTLQDISSLKVPAPAVAYHKSLLTYLVYEKNLLQLNTLAQTDPVRASLIFQGEQQGFNAAQQDLLAKAQALQQNSLSLEQPPQAQRGNIVISFLTDTFGMPKAQALLPVFDPVTWGLITSNQLQNIGQQLLAILKNTLLQILKNTLVAIIQRKVLAWVQGSGAPRFITNWGTTLINAAQTNALNAINKDITSGCVYSAFGPQITVTLKAFYTPSNGAACANAFAAALGANSFQQFYNKFSNGGFLAFGASTLPSGNPYGSQFFEAQKSDLSYHNQQAASNLQTQTGQGFTGDQYCTDGSTPGGSTLVCKGSDGAYGAPNADGSCNAGDTPVHIANGGLCANGAQPLVQTPAAVTAFTLNTAGGATTQQVTAANDIAGLLNSVLSSLMLGLANAAVNAAGQVVNQTLSGITPASITAGTNISGVSASSVTALAASNAPASSTIPLACNPISQTLASPTAGATTPTATSTSIGGPASLSATGGTLDVNDNPPVYYWSDTNGATSTGAFFSDTFATPGIYTVTLTDSTGDAPATCTVTQQ